MVGRFRKCLVFILLTAGAAGAFAQRVTLTVSKTQFSVQEQVQLIFTFEDIKDSPRSVNLELYDHFRVVGGPYSSTSYSWVNGKASSTNKVTYDVIALKPGRIRIPAYEFTVKNQIYKTEPVTVNVTKGPEPQASDAPEALPAMFIQVTGPGRAVYQGETFTLHYYLYTSENVLNYTTNPVSTLEGFIVDRFKLNESPTSGRQIINGKEYLIAGIASLTLTPTMTGSGVIVPKTFRISIKSTSKTRSIWDDPFFGNASEDVTLVAPADTIAILPLPPGAGPHFTGAIGDFQLDASLDSTVIQENQATAVRVRLNGHGNLEHFAFPSQVFSESFEVFEPKVKQAFKLNENDYQGSCTWEYVLIASRPGTYPFNDIAFTYFSPADGQYKTLRAPLKGIRVVSHNELEGDYASALSPDEVRLLSRDIRFIQMGETRYVDAGYDPVRDPRNRTWYYLAALTALAFIAGDFYLSLRIKNMPKIRYKNALKNSMAFFNRIAADIQPEEALTLIESGFRCYLSDKQIAPDGHPGIADVLKTIETYKYAPGMLSHPLLEKLKHRALEIIEEKEAV